MRPIVTLLTDFGLIDPYVGVMKGVILQTSPDVQIIDLSHGVRPQDVTGAAYLLASSWRYFPSGTVHCCVVDPGVGSARKVVGAAVAGHIFVAPDNGLLSLILSDHEPSALIEIENRGQFLKSVSQTFHGRDIFAPTAAVLANGVPLTELGHPLPEPVLIPLPEAVIDEASGEVRGEVIHIDHFGNLITSIRGTQMPWRPRVQIGATQIPHLVKSYADAPADALLALIGSTGRLEISINGGNAAATLSLAIGTSVTVSGMALPE